MQIKAFKTNNVFQLYQCKKGVFVCNNYNRFEAVEKFKIFPYQRMCFNCRDGKQKRSVWSKHTPSLLSLIPGHWTLSAPFERLGWFWIGWIAVGTISDWLSIYWLKARLPWLLEAKLRVNIQFTKYISTIYWYDAFTIYWQNISLFWEGDSYYCYKYLDQKWVSESGANGMMLIKILMMLIMVEDEDTDVAIEKTMMC